MADFGRPRRPILEVGRLWSSSADRYPLSEAAALTRNDAGLLEAQGLPAVGALRVYGKDRRARTITLNSRACEAVSAYLATRANAGSGAALFASRSGLGLTPRGIQRIVDKLMTSAGITGATVPPSGTPSPPT